MRTERLQGLQVPRMCRVYDFRYLMVEGEMLFNQRGLLLRRAGRRNFKPMPGAMTASEFLKRVYVLHLRGGMNFLHTQTRKETVKYIEALYRTWTDEDLDKHKSHIGAYQPPTPIPVSEFRQAVMKWPGIGFKASGAVEKHFNGSLRRAVLASVAEWASITTVDDRGHSRRLGESVAERIVSFMEGK
jgi:ERCC4-type nuclease